MKLGPTTRDKLRVGPVLVAAYGRERPVTFVYSDANSLIKIIIISSRKKTSPVTILSSWDVDFYVLLNSDRD